MGNKKLVIDPKAAIPGQKYQKDKPWSCRYCYWWGKGGCKEKQCHYLASEIKKRELPREPGRCKGCPYGKAYAVHRLLYCSFISGNECSESEVKICRMK